MEQPGPGVLGLQDKHQSIRCGLQGHLAPQGSVANTWEGISEPVVVVPYRDEYGMQHFTAFPKDEFDVFSEDPERWALSTLERSEHT